MQLSSMDHNRNADFLSMFNGVLSAALAVKGNEGMENIAVFCDQAVTGIKGLSKSMARRTFGR